MAWRSTPSNTNEDISLQLHETANSLIQTLIKPETLKRDLFFALLLTVIKENHFILKEKEITTVDYVLTKKAKDGMVYEAELYLNTFQNTPTKIIACPVGHAMLINAIVPDINKETYSLCLDMNKYIKSSALGMPSSLSNSEELYINIKNQIVTPIKTVILNYHHIPSNSLSGLPDDLLQQIILFLPTKDVVNLAKSCRRFNVILKDDQLWFRLYKRDFRSAIKSKEATWRNKYKNMYIMRQDGTLTLTREVSEEIFEDSLGEGYAGDDARNSTWEAIQYIRERDFIL